MLGKLPLGTCGLKLRLRAGRIPTAKSSPQVGFSTLEARDNTVRINGNAPVKTDRSMRMPESATLFPLYPATKFEQTVYTV